MHPVLKIIYILGLLWKINSIFLHGVKLPAQTFLCYVRYYVDCVRLAVGSAEAIVSDC